MRVMIMFFVGLLSVAFAYGMKKGQDDTNISMGSVISAVETFASSPTGKIVIADMEGVASKFLPRLQALRSQAKANGVSSLTASLPNVSTTAFLQTPVADDKGKQKDTSVTATSITSGITYTEDEMLNIMQNFNPVLCQFGKDHNLSTHDLISYAHLLNEIHIDPAVIVGFIKQHHNIDAAPKEYEKKACQKIENTNSDKYMELMLGFFKAIDDSANGQKKATPLSDAYCDILHNKVDDQQETIRYGTYGTILHALVTIGALIWAIYNQKHGGVVSALLNGTLA